MILQDFRADLHVHTCLSPCGELEMTPIKIVHECQNRSIDIVAICDHNSAENVIGVQHAAKGSNVTVLAGMEMTTAEEIHLVALFDKAEQALTLQGKVYGRLLPGVNDPDLFGLQVVANEQDEVEDLLDKLLIGATTIPLDEAVQVIHDLGGMVIASHVDREAYSLIAQLGIIPDDLALDALEISIRGNPDEIRLIPGVDRFPIVRSSDAHELSQLGQVTTIFHIQEPTVDEIRKAFMAQEGRCIKSGEAA